MRGVSRALITRGGGGGGGGDINNNNNKFNTFIALFTIIDQKRFTQLTIDTIFTLLISYIVMKLLNINILKIQYPYLIKSQ